jgi:hypothetical protein
MAQNENYNHEFLDFDTENDGEFEATKIVSQPYFGQVWG